MTTETHFGLRCPTCGSFRFNVVQTMPGAEAVVRARKCVNGHRFYTEETATATDTYLDACREQNLQRKLKG